MSIFIASLAFGSVDPELINWAKLGILVGSISSAKNHTFSASASPHPVPPTSTTSWSCQPSASPFF